MEKSDCNLMRTNSLTKEEKRRTEGDYKTRQEPQSNDKKILLVRPK